MAQEVVCEMLNYVSVVVAALVLGTFGGLITEFIGQARWFSVCVGLITAGVTFGLGTAKATLEIKDKWLDIRRKKRDDEESNARILAPTEEEIRVLWRSFLPASHKNCTSHRQPARASSG
jgi:hypothetical protein